MSFHPLGSNFFKKNTTNVEPKNYSWSKLHKYYSQCKLYDPESQCMTLQQNAIFYKILFHIYQQISDFPSIARSLTSWTFLRAPLNFLDQGIRFYTSHSKHLEFYNFKSTIIIPPLHEFPSLRKQFLPKNTSNV